VHTSGLSQGPVAGLWKNNTACKRRDAIDQHVKAEMQQRQCLKEADPCWLFF
jgi:hypothetical protein